jgi:hypothetical protein
MPADSRHSAVVGSQPSITDTFKTVLGSSYRTSGPYEYGAPSLTSNPFPLVDNPSNINTLSSRHHATPPRTLPMGIFTIPHFLRYLHDVQAALSLFVSLPFFISLETVVNRITI